MKSVVDSIDSVLQDQADKKITWYSFTKRRFGVEDDASKHKVVLVDDVGDLTHEYPGNWVISFNNQSDYDINDLLGLKNLTKYVSYTDYAKLYEDKYQEVVDNNKDTLEWVSVGDQTYEDLEQAVEDYLAERIDILEVLCPVVNDKSYREKDIAKIVNIIRVLIDDDN